MQNQWNENTEVSPDLRQDYKHLSQDDNTTHQPFNSSQKGFKVVDSPYGLNFHCETCDVAVNHSA